MGRERRQQKRTNCSIPCSVQGYGKPVDGVVCNVSAGGLSVQVDMAVEQGDVLAVTLQHAKAGNIDVRGIVWHVRQGRVRGSSNLVRRLGLVLSEAPEAFHALLPVEKPKPSETKSEAPKGGKSKRAGTSAKAKVAPAPVRPALPGRPASPEAEEAPKAFRFRIRVKQDKGLRTRSILVFAKDEDEARVCAREETEPGWHILEIERG
jgi:hypothetical protein